MEKIINKPIAETYGWLHVGGTAVDLPEEPEREVFSLAPGETKTVVRTDAAPYVRYEAALPEGACFHFIEIREADGPARTAADIHVTCGKNARFHWVRLLFDGRETYDNCSAELAGEGSSFAADIGYRLAADHLYDVNCEAIHTGKRTESRIASAGVLADEAGKLLRGTIDFRNVCFRETFPDGLELIPGTTVLRNNANPDGVLMKDLIHKNGFNTGTYGPHSNAVITYQAKFTSGSGKMKIGGQIAHDSGQYNYFKPVIVEALSESAGRLRAGR
jgi:hypothetical protein